MSPLDLARRFIGIKEKTQTGQSTPLVLAMLQECDPSVHDTDTPWCSAFVSFICWLLGLPRSNSLSARSWLIIGQSVTITGAKPGDVVVLSRGPEPQPGPDVLAAPGHVGILERFDGKMVWVLAGNQGNSINVASYPVSRVLGVRRLTA